VGFENELIGQSNFPLGHHRESRRAWLIFYRRQVSQDVVKISSWTAASGPEYAVNGVVYARSKARREAPARTGAASPIVGLPMGMSMVCEFRRCGDPKQALTVIPRGPAFSPKISGFGRWLGFLHRDWVAAVMKIASLDFRSENPTVVKSIKQRDLLNIWLRLYARDQHLPRLDEYQPERLADELPDLVYMTVDNSQTPPRLTIESDGTRMSKAYGNTGKGRYLDDYLGSRLAAVVMPIYAMCLQRCLPIYTIAEIDDIRGRMVAYERLLLPFSVGGAVTHVLASLKTISADGSFEIRNLMRANDTLPKPRLRAVIDRDLFHRTPGRIAAADVIEFT
jgi:hypothetical protein